MQALKQQPTGADRAKKRALERKAKAALLAPVVTPAPGNLQRLPREVARQHLATPTFASHAPALSDEDLADAFAAARGEATLNGQPASRDRLAFEAVLSDSLTPQMQNRLTLRLSDAGLRFHLASQTDYGPYGAWVVRVKRYVLKLEDAGELAWAPDETIVVIGRLSAFHRHFPDAETRRLWQRAGVVAGTGEVVAQMENA